MLIRIPSVLDSSQLRIVRDLLADMDFVEGKHSAGEAAGRVKRNEELSSAQGELKQVNNLLMVSLLSHPLYRYAALPHRVATPLYARYREGMEYGPHLDDAVMGEGVRYRSDIAITVFLSEPDAYAGGELVIGTEFGEQFIKYPAGDAVMYPASSRHRVAKVSGGERLVAVTWVQSMIRDAAKRELLFALYRAREALLRRQPEAAETRDLDSAYMNLVRMWAEV